MSEENRKNVAIWITRIQDTFRGPSGYSGDRVLLLTEMEKRPL
jgi:hypothetical protein